MIKNDDAIDVSNLKFGFVELSPTSKPKFENDFFLIIKRALSNFKI